jgi:sensor histidine kinase YesM
LFFQNSKEKANQAYKNHIAEIEARSLRSRMNPHFLYNAINSIQSIMILKGEIESNRYIGMLSKLLRFTLEISTKENINLEQEIEYINSYVGLQKMRLDPKFDYEIDVDLKKNLNNYIIPPMLIQPVIENAIIHGLSPLKENNGFLKVKIRENKDYLMVRIIDNGIGLKASQALKSKNKNMHKSYATQILRERIDIFNYLEDRDLKFRLFNLEEIDSSRGTTAYLEIPKIN